MFDERNFSDLQRNQSSERLRIQTIVDVMLDDLNELRPGIYKVKDLARACGVCSRTMRRYINKHADLAELQIGHYFTFPVVRMILKRLGYI